jgi:hypothetical protein
MLVLWQAEETESRAFQKSQSAADFFCSLGKVSDTPALPDKRENL